MTIILTQIKIKTNLYHFHFHSANGTGEVRLIIRDLHQQNMMTALVRLDNCQQTVEAIYRMHERLHLIFYHQIHNSHACLKYLRILANL